MIEKKRLKRDLAVFLTIVISLLVLGLLFIYSASSVFALEKFGSAHYYLKKQLFGLLIGIGTAIAIQYIPLSTIKKLSPYFFLSCLGLTALTIFSNFGQHIHGSVRWLSLPFIAFQPSELLKLSLIIYVAYFLEKKEKSNRSVLTSFIMILIFLACTSFILLKQPDFGLMVVLIATVLIMLFIVNFGTKYLTITLLASIPLLIGLILTKSYRIKRILTFLNPWTDAKGSGFQIIQSLIAIGSGGFFGVGIGQSKQKFFYLPMQHTDFIFSIIAEETGFIGASTILFLFLLFLYFGFRIALQLYDRFSALVTLGFVTVISLQALINMCVTTGLAPTKGMGLPFISYGNTALVCHLAMIGIIIAFVYKNKKAISHR